MKTFLVPDIHGHYSTLRALLKEAGVLDENDQRVEGWHVIQIGDLANCVSTDRDGDLACLMAVGSWIDEMLVGNHEHPYFGGPSFGGFWSYPEVEIELRRIEKEGLIHASAVVDDILITHAGVVKTLAEGYGWQSAEEAHALISELWQRDKSHMLFSAIGRSRGGWSHEGGILWSDWMEPKTPLFKQIVGHTPQTEGVQEYLFKEGKWARCIDCGVKAKRGATGVVIEPGILTLVSVPFYSGNHF